jgi:hypothetical protein
MSVMFIENSKADVSKYCCEKYFANDAQALLARPVTKLMARSSSHRLPEYSRAGIHRRTTYTSTASSHRLSIFGNDPWSRSQAQGVANRKPYPAMCSERMRRWSVIVRRIVKTAATPNGDRSNIRLAMVLVAIRSGPASMVFRGSDQQSIFLVDVG